MVSDLRGRVRTGPLNDRQHDIVQRVMSGMYHIEIAGELHVTKTCVSENMSIVVMKMGARNSAEAVAMYAKYEALCEVAEMLGHKSHPHLARQVRAEATKLLPK